MPQGATHKAELYMERSYVLKGVTHREELRIGRSMHTEELYTRLVGSSASIQQQLSSTCTSNAISEAIESTANLGDQRRERDRVGGKDQADARAR